MYLPSVVLRSRLECERYIKMQLQRLNAPAKGSHAVKVSLQKKPFLWTPARQAGATEQSLSGSRTVPSAMFLPPSQKPSNDRNIFTCCMVLLVPCSWRRTKAYLPWHDWYLQADARIFMLDWRFLLFPLRFSTSFWGHCIFCCAWSIQNAGFASNILPILCSHVHDAQIPVNNINMWI